MKIAVQYVSDSKGKKQAVQLPIMEWEKILSRLKKYEQAVKLKSDLKESLNQVSRLRKTKNKQTLKEFLNEL